MRWLLAAALAALLSYGVFGLGLGPVGGASFSTAVQPWAVAATAPRAPYAVAPEAALTPFQPGARVSGWLNTDQDITLERLRGHAVLLSFWAHWCVPCLEKFPLLNELQDRYEQAGLVVLAVAVEDEQAAVALLRSGRAKVILGVGAPDLFRRYEVNAIPLSVVLGRDGALVAKLDYAATPQQHRQAVERALGAPHGALYSWRQDGAAAGRAAGKLPPELERPRDAWAFSKEEAWIAAKRLMRRAGAQRSFWDRLLANLPPLSPDDIDQLYEFYLRNLPRSTWQGDECARAEVLAVISRIVKQPNVRDDARRHLLELLLKTPDDAAAAAQARLFAALASFESLRSAYAAEVRSFLNASLHCASADSPATQTAATRALSYWDGAFDEPVDSPLERARVRFQAEQDRFASALRAGERWHAAQARFKRSLELRADEVPSALVREFSARPDPDDPYDAFRPLNMVQAAERILYGDFPATPGELRTIYETLADAFCRWPDADSSDLILSTLLEFREHLPELPVQLRAHVWCVASDYFLRNRTYARWLALRLKLELEFMTDRDSK